MFVTKQEMCPKFVVVSQMVFYSQRQNYATVPCFVVRFLPLLRVDVNKEVQNCNTANMNKNCRQVQVVTRCNG